MADDCSIVGGLLPCLERYEKLVDALRVSRKKTMSQMITQGSCGPERLIPTPNLNPHVRIPADMDEDEKEMLSQARARLANTVGKESLKEKPREKQP
ncbi:hypothetical protein IFM89_014496 [Coptis chinensis]|uniref:Uncharacterized protein n=1 Tax=Coptis chinensis TaxID=261450 RepID=A0A835IQ12_9MAGN|nr:hypothetical protein IFM89_014496 [Coptis chinensis]